MKKDYDKLVFWNIVEAAIFEQLYIKAFHSNKNKTSSYVFRNNGSCFLCWLSIQWTTSTKKIN